VTAQFAAGALLAPCVVAAVLFCLGYALESAWRSSPMGRCLMLLVGTVGALAALRTWVYLWGPFPGVDWVFAAGYVPLSLALLWLGLLLRRVQRRGRGGVADSRRD
jgi:hypothetical protein